MTTANEVIERAMSLLGYTDRIGQPDSEKFSAAYRTSLAYINTVGFELAQTEGKTWTDITDGSNVLPLSTVSVNDIMPYGVAMWIAQSDSDYTAQSVFANLYSQKKRSAPRAQIQVTMSYTIPKA